MIKPFIKGRHNAKVVLVAGLGVVRLDELPKRIWFEEKGVWQIGWCPTAEGYVLSVYGGKSTLDFNSEEVGVREIIAE